MNRDPGSLGGRFLTLCLCVLLGMLALQWAMHILEGIWATLALAAVVVLALFALLRWRRNRW